jgi:hypothetical protein
LSTWMGSSPLWSVIDSDERTVMYSACRSVIGVELEEFIGSPWIRETWMLNSDEVLAIRVWSPTWKEP